MALVSLAIFALEELVKYSELKRQREASIRNNLTSVEVDERLFGYGGKSHEYNDARPNSRFKIVSNYLTKPLGRIFVTAGLHDRGLRRSRSTRCCRFARATRHRNCSLWDRCVAGGDRALRRAVELALLLYGDW